MSKILGFLTPVMIFAIIFILNALLPGRWVNGYIANSDGNNTLLVNGFCELSRHFNYSGEVLMAAGIILCTGYP
jgi:protein-S-isoprenylcysteine O-methyltransferase Ste14